MATFRGLSEPFQSLPKPIFIEQQASRSQLSDIFHLFLVVDFSSWPTNLSCFVLFINRYWTPHWLCRLPFKLYRWPQPKLRHPKKTKKKNKPNSANSVFCHNFSSFESDQANLTFICVFLQTCATAISPVTPFENEVKIASVSSCTASQRWSCQPRVHYCWMRLRQLKKVIGAA